MGGLQTETNKPKQRVIWVDDEPNILASVRRLFRNLPVDLTTFENPGEALSALRSSEYDLVVSDQRMPQMSGLDLLSQAKSLAPLSTRIMVTGFLEPQLIHEAVNRGGVYRFITKPWDEAQLRADIESALRHSDLARRQRLLREGIAAKTSTLMELNTRLEQKDLHDRSELEEVRKQLRLKEEGIRDLARFLRDLSLVSSMEDLVALAASSLRRLAGVRMVWVWVRDSEGKSERWTYSEGGDVRRCELKPQDSKDVRETASRVFGRPILQTSEFPLMRSKLFREAGFTVEHLDLKSPEDLYLTSRIRALNEALERVLLEEHLILAARQWERTFDIIPHPVAIVGKDFQVTRANHRFEQLGGGERCYERWGLEAPCDGCPLLDPKQRDSGMRIGRLKIKGRVVEVRSYKVPREAQGQFVWVNHYHDLSESERTLRSSIDREKMVALGKLAGDVAHRLRNPIAGVKGLVQIWIHSLNHADPVRSDLIEILGALERSENIIKHLQEFVEGLDGDGDQGFVDLNELVTKTIPLIKTALRRFSFDQETSPEPIPIRGNFGLLQQVLLNLLNNSIQALDEGGRLGVRTQISGEWGALEVTDEGHGIPVEVQRRVFEPFFTTKKEGLGTGLGLSLTKEIVERFGGTIEFDSEVGKGTRFLVRFPLRRF